MKFRAGFSSGRALDRGPTWRQCHVPGTSGGLGLAVEGAGDWRVLRHVGDELREAMRLAGATTLAEMTRDLVCGDAGR